MVSKALSEISKGTIAIFLGTIISFILGFLSRIAIARGYSVEDYGIFNLTITVLSLFLIFSTLGFRTSLPREIAMGRYVETISSTAITIVILNSLALSLILILSSDFISGAFHNDALRYTLKVASISLPFSSLVWTITSISRGFGRVRERLYYQNFLNPLLFLIFVIFSISFDLDFKFVFLFYILSWILTSILLISRWKVNFGIDRSIAKRILIFSLPLMFTGMLNFVMNWMDTVMLGFLMNPKAVGIYNAASPIARTLTIIITSSSFLYMPIATKLYQEKLDEFKELYQVLTKLIFLLTFPIFLTIFLFPESVISYTFGSKYVDASLALQILSLGFIFHTFLGLNGVSLVVIGKPNLNLFSDIIATILNITLNLLLIPSYGVVGASLATSTSYVVTNVLRSGWLYREVRLHPFGSNYITISLLSLTLISFHMVYPSLILFTLPMFYILLIKRDRDFNRLLSIFGELLHD